MIHTIDLDDDTSELLQAHSALTGLSVGALIDRLLSVHLEGLHEMLALVRTHAALRTDVANILQSFGPESLADGIKRIAPAGYETLGEQFSRQVMQFIDPPQAAH